MVVTELKSGDPKAHSRRGRFQPRDRGPVLAEPRAARRVRPSVRRRDAQRRDRRRR